MPDFGFVGASYEAPSIYQDAQECINFFCEIDPTKQQGARGVVAMYPTPGLVKIAQLFAGEVRGLHTLSNENYLSTVLCYSNQLSAIKLPSNVAFREFQCQYNLLDFIEHQTLK